MTFHELAERRVSVRSYTDQPVGDEVLRQILTAGALAPTACNLQPLRFVAVRDRSQIEKLAAGYPADWFAEAPAVIAVCTLPDEAWKRSRHDHRNYADVDGAIATDHITLAAQDLGLGTCWIAAFDPGVVRSVLNIPAYAEPLVLLTVGYPNDAGRPKERKSLDELVCYEVWQ